MVKEGREGDFGKSLGASLQGVIEFLKSAEAKNGALLTLASVWGLAVINILVTEKPIPPHYKAALSLSLPFIIVAGLVAILLFVPRRRPGGVFVGPPPRARPPEPVDLCGPRHPTRGEVARPV